VRRVTGVAYPQSVTWNVRPWLALLICVVGGLGVVVFLSATLFALSGLGDSRRLPAPLVGDSERTAADPVGRNAASAIVGSTYTLQRTRC
jgi:hypothetical protein